MSKRVKLPISSEKLEEALELHGFTKRTASEAIGRTSTYMNHKISDGWVWNTDAQVIEVVLGILYDTYKSPEPVEEPSQYQQMTLEDYAKNDPQVIPSDTPPCYTADTSQLISQLYHAIYSAVFNALQDALKDVAL